MAEKEFYDFLGYVGAFLTGVTFIPQVWKTWQSRSARDLSLSMMLIVLTSTIVWLVYAFGQWLWPVIIANLIVFVLSLVLIFFKMTFK